MSPASVKVYMSHIPKVKSLHGHVKGHSQRDGKFSVLRHLQDTRSSWSPN